MVAADIIDMKLLSKSCFPSMIAVDVTDVTMSSFCVFLMIAGKQLMLIDQYL